MKIVICIDFSTFTEKMLSTALPIINSFREPDISVVHVIDESSYFAATGAEMQLSEGLDNENRQLREMVEIYLGKNIHYIEESGIPRLKIDEILDTLNYDLLIIGSHSTHGLGSRLMGGMAEHLLHRSQKPVLFIP